jgi:hypothetical protein
VKILIRSVSLIMGYLVEITYFKLFFFNLLLEESKYRKGAHDII